MSKPQYETIEALFEALRLGDHKRGQIQFLVDTQEVSVVEFEGYDVEGSPLASTLLVEGTPQRLLCELGRHLGFYAEEI